jgi:Na+/melibiose symporter-like transporter
VIPGALRLMIMVVPVLSVLILFVLTEKYYMSGDEHYAIIEFWSSIWQITT